jgi:transposase
MKKYSEAFVAFDTAKTKHAVAIAAAGRDGEIRYLGCGATIRMRGERQSG